MEHQVVSGEQRQQAGKVIFVGKCPKCHAQITCDDKGEGFCKCGTEFRMNAGSAPKK